MLSNCSHQYLPHENSYISILYIVLDFTDPKIWGKKLKKHIKPWIFKLFDISLFFFAQLEIITMEKVIALLL